MDVKDKTYSALILILICIWSVVLIFSIPKPQSDIQAPLLIKTNAKIGENSLTFPHSEPGSYCDSWKNTKTKTVWTDRPSAYSSLKLIDFGWNMLKSNKNGKALQFINPNNLNYDETEWKTVSKAQFQETNEALFLIPKEANVIFTRMYWYGDSDNNNIQTARLGIDYACPGQIFNHIPGASAFCRKDYLQEYILDYQRRYASLGLFHCFTGSLTPKSYIMNEPEHCKAFIDELERQTDKFNSKNMPIEWILKSPLQHKGYGIQLIDFEKANYYINLYRGNLRKEINCYNVAEEDKHLIAQKYISNPALIQGRKFDFRVFAIIINSDPLVALWAPENGHTRLSDQEFDKLSSDFTTHITANVAGANPDSLEFLKSYRFNLREIAYYFRDILGDHEAWLERVAFPQIKKNLIHMFRSTQQNFLIKRIGLMEFYGVDFIMNDTLENIYLLESNRRPDVQEKNPNLQYREDMLLEDFSTVAEYFLKTGANSINTNEIFRSLKAFKPLIDETKNDPYFGVLPIECRIPFKDLNTNLPTDPMIAPLKHYVNSKE
ncbi:unnamed protein product [Blepharisma stoltei]|uniref:Tubulin-tyrosine ligase family protein n=1 Tax=Blepharisma stoltei TaxID=1481888 RepID=A0AAU9KQB3_9CILI|nr:unnamed protein product [Blepharisma stoltei]